ncbi:MAG: hypothetical protein KIT27_10120 [Legionellales bacterium]|nr:hypothetical protein [Legionellales bacterium]
MQQTSHNLSELLANSAVYLRQIELLYERYLNRNLLFTTQQEGVHFAQIYQNRQTFSKLLAQEIIAQTYQFTPARKITLFIKEKPRIIYRFAVSDFIVHGVLASLLMQRSQSYIHPAVYSYQAGISAYEAVADLARFVRQHIHSTPEIKQRGLFVLKSDIAAYTDNIPVHDDSLLWKILEDYLQHGFNDLTPQHIIWPLLKQCIRPHIQKSSGELIQNTLGVPTGSPITSFLYNLYAHSLDNAMTVNQEGFYARYCDDIIYLHESYDVILTQRQKLQEALQLLQLTSNTKKEKCYYFNGAGRNFQAKTVWSGKQYLDFLGMRVTFKGEIGLKPKQVRILLRDIRRRVLGTIKLLSHESQETQGEIVCKMLNKLFNSRGELANKQIQKVLTLVTDRVQLRNLDKLIALTVAEALTKKRGIIAFNHIPYKKIRLEWQLQSLYHQRNKV